MIIGYRTLRHRAVADLLSTHGDVEVIQEHPCEVCLLRLIALRQPDIIALEASPSEAARVETIPALQSVAPRTIVLLAPHGDASAGAVGARVADSTSPAFSGRPPATVHRERSVSQAGSGNTSHPLSPRELDVLTHAASAMTNQQIARTLNISTGTVKSHMHRVFRKLGAVSRLDAVTKATAGRLIPPAPDAEPALPRGSSA